MGPAPFIALYLKNLVTFLAMKSSAATRLWRSSNGLDWCYLWLCLFLEHEHGLALELLQCSTCVFSLMSLPTSLV